MGGFISDHSKKKIQSVPHISTPFSEKLSFNVLLNYNDGLLANHIVKNEKLTYSEALIEIEKFVDEFHKELDSEKKFIIEQVGVLYKDTGSNIRIEPIKNPNYLVDSIGKTNLPSNPVSTIVFNHATEKQYEISGTSSPSKSEQHNSISFRKVKLIFLSFLLTGSVFGLCLYFYFSTNSELNSASNNSTKIVVPDQPVEKIVAKSAGPVSTTDVTPENVDGGSTNTFVEKETTIPKPSIESENTSATIPVNKYFLIAGSFKSPENAKRKLDELKLQGFKNAQIFSDNRNLQLVCYDGFNTLHEAQENMKGVKIKYKEAWIYNR